jgi:hypothetical protein
MIIVSYTTDPSVTWSPRRPYVKYATSHQYQNTCKDLNLRELQMTNDLVITTTQPIICLEIPTPSISQNKLSAPTKHTFIYHVLKCEWRKEQALNIQQKQAGTNYRHHLQVCSAVQTCKTVLKHETRLRSRVAAKGESKGRGEEEIQEWMIKVKETKRKWKQVR